MLASGLELMTAARDARHPGAPAGAPEWSTIRRHVGAVFPNGRGVWHDVAVDGTRTRCGLELVELDLQLALVEESGRCRWCAIASSS